MTKFEELEEETHAAGLTIKERPLRHSDGLVKGRKIYLRTGQTLTEKTCVLAEEIAHAELTVGNILNQSTVSNRKQEMLARTKAYDRLVGLSGLVEAFEHGCRNRYETAEFLEVTEEFLESAVQRYREKYGLYTKFGSYVIQFEPWLSVIKLL